MQKMDHPVMRERGQLLEPAFTGFKETDRFLIPVKPVRSIQTIKRGHQKMKIVLRNVFLKLHNNKH